MSEVIARFRVEDAKCEIPYGAERDTEGYPTAVRAARNVPLDVTVLEDGIKLEYAWYKPTLETPTWVFFPCT